MFKSTRELKAFISWAKNNHVKRIKSGDIEIEISDIAFIPELNPPKAASNSLKVVQYLDPKSGLSEPKVESEDEDLFWSVTN
jgi:hypothetical protein